MLIYNQPFNSGIGQTAKGLSRARQNQTGTLPYSVSKLNKIQFSNNRMKFICAIKNSSEIRIRMAPKTLPQYLHMALTVSLRDILVRVLCKLRNILGVSILGLR
jgi:hypothetical protein